MTHGVVAMAFRQRPLMEIADSIRAHWSATEEDRFAIGRDLLEARQQFPDNIGFGQWLDTQGFPFSRQWAGTLRLAAEHEPEVRTALASQLADGRTANIEKAVKAVLRPEPEPIRGVGTRFIEEVPPTGEEASDPDSWRALVQVMDSIEALCSRDASYLAATVPSRRRAATARRIRKLGTQLGRIAWTLEGSEVPA